MRQLLKLGFFISFYNSNDDFMDFFPVVSSVYLVMLIDFKRNGWLMIGIAGGKPIAPWT